MCWKELALIAAALLAIARRRAAAIPRIAMVAVLVAAGVGVAALHVFAARSYGSWPAALALFALFSANLVMKRLQATAPEPARRT